MIEGNVVTLRPATLDDRRMVYDWSHTSDIASILHLSDGPPETFEVWCSSWRPYYFSDESPELGRVFLILAQGVPVGAIAYNDIDAKHRVELDIWMSCEANCGKGFGPDAIHALRKYLSAQLGVNTFMMQPSARNPRAIRAYEKAGFVRTPASPEEIKSDWGGVDHPDSVLMIRDMDRAVASQAP